MIVTTAMAMVAAVLAGGVLDAVIAHDAHLAKARRMATRRGRRRARRAGRL